MAVENVEAGGPFWEFSPEYKQVSHKGHLMITIKPDIASRRSVSPDRPWLKRDIQRIMLTHTISCKFHVKPDIASRRSVSPDGTWLKHDIQRIMLTHTISCKLSSQPKKLQPIISETQDTTDIRD